MSQTKNKVGKPLKFKTVKELEKAIDKYREYVKKYKKPMTIGRLAVFLECDNKTIWNYSQKDEYFPTIKKICQEILASKEEKLIDSSGNVTGLIFDLKNNHGFKDKQEVEQTGTTTTYNIEVTGKPKKERIEKFFNK